MEALDAIRQAGRPIKATDIGNLFSHSACRDVYCRMSGATQSSL